MVAVGSKKPRVGSVRSVESLVWRSHSITSLDQSIHVASLDPRGNRLNPLTERVAMCALF
jgi:hypothetical protein